MSRMRSPNYPSVPLGQAIDLVAKIHRTCRTNIITRENAAQEMGYTGSSGRSMKVLSSLLQFGLLTKAGTGDVKVSQRAVDILHGIEVDDRNEAMLEAAYAPQLFQNIHERFPDGIPSETVIRSYLIQQDFLDRAISPAISAFLETYRSVEHLKEGEPHENSLNEVIELPEMPQELSKPQSNGVASPAVPTLPHQASTELNKINMDIRGDQVSISGLLNLKGLNLLEKKIAALKLLLTVYTDANDIGDDLDE
jgi:hypothetical protein